MKSVIFFFGIVCAAIGWSAIPQQISYQGLLADPMGNPLDTTVAMTFKLYGTSSGGAAMWTETHPSVVVGNGLFQVLLGSVTPIPDVFTADRWLEVTVGNDTEMSPRSKIVSVAHAYRVGTIDGASGGVVTGDVNIVGDLQTDTLRLNNALRFSNGTYQLSAFDTSGLATRVWVQSNGYLRGSNNSASGTGFVGGGDYNNATGSYATVSGGDSCSASSINSTVGGGWHNRASGGTSTVSGGSTNTASGSFAAVGGGVNNTATGWSAMVPGGAACSASGDLSFAAGYRARAAHSGSFVWADNTDNDYFSDGINSFNVRAFGGVKMYTSAGGGAQLPAGTSGWISISDSTQKTDIRLVDTKRVLEIACKIPIKEWRYQVQPDPNIRHMGPMAQDFWNAFHLGEDSLGISTIDPDGVALAAIQELAKRNDELEQRVKHLEAALLELSSNKSTGSR